MHAALTKTDHRPWPLPPAAWSWRQSWNNLLFVHYRIAAKDLAPLVPRGMTIQEFDGSSWIGVVPFEMNGVMRRPFPDLPGFSRFFELNVRLYVEYQGKAGVWFLSLDATNPLAVWGGRELFSLPYRHASIQVSQDGDSTRFHSVRREEGRTEFKVRYRPTSEVFAAVPGTVEHFLTERYCLFAPNRRGLARMDVHHWPWPLQVAEADVSHNGLLDAFGLHVEGPALLHYSTGVDVVSWGPVF
jgi:hypothetical protein